MEHIQNFLPNLITTHKKCWMIVSVADTANNRKKSQPILFWTPNKDAQKISNKNHIYSTK